MILQRLYELADRENLLDDTAFVSKEIACRVDIDASGNFLGLHDLRQRIERPAKGKSATKTVVTGGKLLQIPVRPVVRDSAGKWKTTDPAAAGKEKPAVFLADTIARVLPVEGLIDVDKREKFASQRGTFWRFMSYCVEELQADDLKAVVLFAERIANDDALHERIASEVKSLGLTTSDLCTIALSTEMGKCLAEREDVRAWWREFFGADFAVQQQAGTKGLCQVTGLEATIGQSVKSKVKGLVPIGCRADAYLVTGLDSADSFNLSGAEASMVSPQGIDGFTRALNALIGNDFHGKATSHRVNGVMFLFWTREKIETPMTSLFEPDPDQVNSLIGSVGKGRVSRAIVDANVFYLLTISANSARVVVRDYLETPVANITQALAQWFKDLKVADLSKDGQGFPKSDFPMWLLASATAMDSEGVAPDTPARLMGAAIKGLPISDSILAACLRRLRAEGAEGFRAARMALIKLTLIRKGIDVNETLDQSEMHPAYLYGRLLSVFEQIQYDALKNVNANVVDKFYGTFSAAPALVFSRLFANAQNHLRKIKSENPGAYVSDDKLLSEIVALLPASPPRGQLSLQDQGRFALGYYHQRAKRFQQIAERKAEKAGVVSSPD